MIAYYNVTNERVNELMNEKVLSANEEIEIIHRMNWYKWVSKIKNEKGFLFVKSMNYESEQCNENVGEWIKLWML